MVVFIARFQSDTFLGIRSLHEVLATYSCTLICIIAETKWFSYKKCEDYAYGNRDYMGAEQKNLDYVRREIKANKKDSDMWL